MSPGHVSMQTGGRDTALLPTVSKATAKRCHLGVVVLGPKGIVDFHELGRDAVLVGRDPDSDIVFADPATSRNHARLLPKGGGLEVTDLGSRNGVFVDGRLVDCELCSPGSVIRIGSYNLLVLALSTAWEEADRHGSIVGGVSLAPARRTISLVGPTTLSVLITGETGTGKEEVARALHARSQVASGSFVAVNCAALPENLIESEMFGHVQGAFSGSTRSKRGLFTLADGGTLFLDEVGELPLNVQAKLLRVLEDGMVRPVGAEKTHEVKVRVLSATNADLHGQADAGRFRRDLLARLAQVEVKLPPLRHRREDLLALMEFLLKRAGHRPLEFSPDAVEALVLHSWPSNVREVDSLIRLLALHHSGDTPVELQDLPEHLRLTLERARALSKASVALRDSNDELRERVIATMTEHQGNVRQAALTMNVARGHMYRLLKRFAIDPKPFRTGGTELAE